MALKIYQSATFRQQRQRLLDLLIANSFQKRPVVLSSGTKSNFYIDCKQSSLHTEGLFLIGQLYRAVLDEVAPEAEAVGGLTLGADPLSTATSLVSFLAGKGVHAFLVRKEPKGHGTAQWIEGMSNLRAGMPVVILEDVVTTGASTIKAIERARQAELDVVHVITLVDRLEDGGQQAVTKLVPMTSLYTRQDFPL